jgi:hypothetical protein
MQKNCFLIIICSLCCRYIVDKMMNHVYVRPNYVYCRVWMNDIPCGTYNGSDYLFWTEELQSRMNYFDGILISDYALIISRSSYFYHGGPICSQHRYFLCEGYVPKLRCVECFRTTELMQMSYRVSLFIQNMKRVPIRKYMKLTTTVLVLLDSIVVGYICKSCRSSYERQMEIANFQNFLIPRNGLPSLWDCIAKSSAIIHVCCNSSIQNLQELCDF